MAFLRKIPTGLVKSDFEAYIGIKGNIFVNADTGEIRLSDGVTLGGLKTVNFASITASAVDQENEMAYSRRTDFISDNLIYRGEATPGSNAAAAVWRIRRLVTAEDGDIAEEWASGNASFDKVWNDRLALAYS
jgi:hypothetical protein